MQLQSRVAPSCVTTVRACPPPPPLPPGPAEDGGVSGAQGGAGSTPQQRLSDFVLPACDSKAICAYLALFR